jgi:hypothetical protein
MLVVGIDLAIGYVDNGALEDRPPCKEGPGWARREHAMQLLEGFGGVVVLSDTMEQLAVELIERAEESRTNSALLTIVSNTGCTSVGETLITRRISLVAVRCCCALSSVRPDVLDGDHRLMRRRS